jgi:hypothetical protein
VDTRDVLERQLALDDADGAVRAEFAALRFVLREVIEVNERDVGDICQVEHDADDRGRPCRSLAPHPAVNHHDSLFAPEYSGDAAFEIVQRVAVLGEKD